MKHYTVTGGPVSFHLGAVLALSAEQASLREHNLEPVGDWYRVTDSVQFKVGEEIGLEGDLPKSLIDILTPIEPDKPAPKKTTRSRSRKTPAATGKKPAAGSSSTKPTGARRAPARKSGAKKPAGKKAAGKGKGGKS